MTDSDTLCQPSIREALQRNKAIQQIQDYQRLGPLKESYRQQRRDDYIRNSCTGTKKNNGFKKKNHHLEVNHTALNSTKYSNIRPRINMSLDHEFENSFFSPKEATNTTETLGLFRPLDIEDETITESFNLISKQLN